MPKKDSIDTFIDIARERNGKCLSRKYVNARTKLKFRCKEGHVWESDPYSVKKGSWCRKCADKDLKVINTKGSFEYLESLVKSKKGELLIEKDSYEGKSKRHPVRCSCGYTFKASIDTIERGNWCNSCSSKRGAEKKKLGIEKLKQLAEEKGGKCLSSEYVKLITSYDWECEKGHHWTASANSIKNQGTWCPECALENKKVANKLSVKEINKRLKSIKITCVSDENEYSGTSGKLKFSCKKGHEFSYTVDHILRKSECPKCTVHAKREQTNLDWKIRFEKEIRKKKGKADLKKFKTKNTKISITCYKGHNWSSSAYNILTTGSWCPSCGIERMADQYRHDISVFKKVANERKGKCLSNKNEYENNQSKLRWRCEDGHEWSATAGSVKAGSWCPYCTGSIGEELTRVAFEAIFKKKFPRSYPKWLKSKKGHQLELDGFCKSINLAFEHHGEHHYSTKCRFSKTKKDLSDRKKADEFKIELARKNGVTIIEVPQVNEKIELENLVKFIIEKTEACGFDAKVKNPRPKYNLAYGGRYKKTYEEVLDIAKKNKGKVLSKTYMGSEVKIKLECSKGHRFAYYIGHLRKGYWCRECSDAPSLLKFSDLRSMAKEKGGKVLTKSYLGYSVRHEWQCSEGHKWKASVSNIRAGKWCKKCADKKRVLERKKKTLQRFIELAKEKGGKCLSETYVDASSPLNFTCAEGHSFERIPAGINQGLWCPECIKIRRYEERVRKSEERQIELNNFVKKYDGKCLKVSRVEKDVYYLFRCKFGHEWEARYPDVKGRGSWCKRCASKKKGSK